MRPFACTSLTASRPRRRPDRAWNRAPEPAGASHDSLTGEQRYANQADRILQLLGGLVEKSAPMLSNALVAVDLRRRGTTEVVIVGDRPDLVRLAQSIWRPDTVLAWGEPYDSPLWHDRTDGFAYVCRDYACQTPQDTLQGLAEALTGRKVEIREITNDRDA